MERKRLHRARDKEIGLIVVAAAAAAGAAARRPGASASTPPADRSALGASRFDPCDDSCPCLPHSLDALFNRESRPRGAQSLKSTFLPVPADI